MRKETNRTTKQSVVRAVVLLLALAVVLGGCNHVLSLLFLGDFELTYRAWFGDRSAGSVQSRGYETELTPTDLGNPRHWLTPSEFTLFIPRIQFEEAYDSEKWVVVVATFPEPLEEEYYLADFVNEATHVYPPRGRAGTMDLLQIVIPGGGPREPGHNESITHWVEYQLGDLIVFELPDEYSGIDLNSMNYPFTREGNTVTLRNYQNLAERAIPYSDSQRLPDAILLGDGFPTRIWYADESGEAEVGSPSPAQDEAEAEFGITVGNSQYLLADLGQSFEVPLNGSGYDASVEFDYRDVIVIWDNNTPYVHDDIVTLAPGYWSRFKVDLSLK